ncbi:hypothetical protein OBB02_01335 [Candidatus Puniceispirillum sp.]|nr:hypothetical protein [Candidatus Puniceispirillum sp.]
MWLFSQNDQKICWCVIRLIGIAFFGFVLSACGEVSIHQLGQDNQDSLKKIMVTDVRSREGQIYTRELRKKLHIGGKLSEAYLLSSEIKTASSATISVQGAASSLKKMSMTATFELNDLETGESIYADSVSGDATLGSVSSLYGQDESESHARERLAILLAQRVGRRLQLYFLEHKQ